MKYRLYLLLIMIVMINSCDDHVNPNIAQDNSEWKEIKTKNYEVVIVKGADQPTVKYDSHEKIFHINSIWGSSHIIWESNDEKFIYLLLWDGIRTGGILAKININQKKAEYFIGLIGLGRIDHSQYHNDIRLFQSKSLIKICGFESYGSYIEIRNIEDGSLINISQKYNDKVKNLNDMITVE